MGVTVAGLVTPHLLKVVELASQAQTGANVDWHVRDAVTKTIGELVRQYNARDLLAAYLQGLETAVENANRDRKLLVRVALQSALTQAQALSRNAVVAG